MKKCPKQLFSPIKVIFLFYHFLIIIVGFSMWAFIIEESLFVTVADARCIHDQLKFAIKDQSPQVYDGLTSFPTTQHSLIEEKTSSTESFVQSNKEIEVYENVLSTLRFDDALTSAKFKSETNGIYSSENISLSTRRSEPSNVSTKLSDKLNIYSNATTSITQVARQNSSDIFTALSLVNVTFKPIRLSIWYDFSHISFANNSIEYEKLKQGLDRSVETIKKLLSGVKIAFVILFSSICLFKHLLHF